MILVTGGARSGKSAHVEQLAAFIAHLKSINPKVKIVFQLTHSGEISEPEFSRRVTVKPIS